MKVSLPDKLDGKEYEESVGAFIKANGYFTERRLILSHQGRELLELDIVASPANNKIRERILLDAKSGKKTGFSDVFKIFGWKTFLEIPYGCIVRKTKPDDTDVIALEKYFDDLQMSWEVFSLEGEISLDLSKTIPTVIEIDDKLMLHHFFTAWWFSIAERIAFFEYNKFIKQNSEDDLVTKLRTYEKACNLSFFEKNPLKRVIALVNAFKNNPGISGECITFLSSQNDISESDIKKDAFETEKYLWLQYVMLLENRARYSIIKCAVEIINTPKTENQLERYSDNQLFSSTSKNFQKGYTALKKNMHYLKIPYLLQIFIESFGGYYIDSDADIGLISEITQIPKDQVVGCLEILNVFFPAENGWWIPTKNLRLLKFTPAFVRGIGSFMRKDQICERYSDLTSMGWLLSKYHDVAIDVIAMDEKLKQ